MLIKSRPLLHQWEFHIRRRWKLQDRRQAHIIGSQSIALRLQSARWEWNLDGERVWRGTAGGGVERKSVVGLRAPDQKEKMTCQPLACLRRAVCVFWVHSHMAAWLHVFEGRQRLVHVIQIDLDVAKAVQIQGHWIISPVGKTAPTRYLSGKTNVQYGI